MVAKTSGKKSEHPTYEVMVVAAIKALKNRKGSSKQAVLKYIVATYNLKGDPNIHAKIALRKLIKNGKVEVASGTGLAGRFKLKASAVDVTAKKPKKAQKSKKTTKKTAKKPAAKSKKSLVKKSPKKSPKKASKKSKSQKKAKKSSPKKQSAKQSTTKKQRKSAKKSTPQKKSKK